MAGLHRLLTDSGSWPQRPSGPGRHRPARPPRRSCLFDAAVVAVELAIALGVVVLLVLSGVGR
jgi:hypothetical protein